MAALGLVGFRLGRLETLVARVDVAFEHDSRQSASAMASQVRALTIRIGKPCDGAGNADLVAPVRHDRVAECAASQQRSRRRHAEAERQRHRLLVAVGFGDDLPHVAARRDLEGADVAPAEIHAVVAEVGAAAEGAAGNAADAGADRQFLPSSAV